MARNAENTFPGWLRYFDTIDSTNNYAMALVDDGLAQHGMVIWAGRQTAGKGQRGKNWENDGGNVMMSLIVKPLIAADKQFILSMLVAHTIVRYLETIYTQWQVAIKWPNDIYINDKKACGILIENVFRGMNWTHAVIGIGLNVNQKAFPSALSGATSLHLASGTTFELQELISDIRSGLLNNLKLLQEKAHYEHVRNDYNKYLFRKDKETLFEDRSNGKRFSAFVQEVNENGQLILLGHNGIEQYNFGTLDWIL